MENKKLVYLDNAASTKPDKEVIEEINRINSKFYGNASSLHELGQKSRDIVENSRLTIAQSINTNVEDIIFTSGGTESNNTAIKSIAFNKRKKENKKHIICSKIEHPSVYKVLKWLEQNDFDISFVNVDNQGFLNLNQLDKLLNKNPTSIVSIIHGNNEIGTIQNIKEISKIVHKYDSLLHIDACQSFTKVQINVKELGADLITLNAHKIHGPKGIGALYLNDVAKKTFTKWQHGGSHEFNLRAGTEDVSSIAGFAKAVELNKYNEKNITKIKELRDHLVKRILNEIKYSRLNGPDIDDKNKRLVNNANISFKSVEGEAILMYMDSYGIAVSTGSACSSKSLEPSHVLLALGLNHEDAHSSIRFSFSKYNTKEDVDYCVDSLIKVIDKLRKMSPVWKG